MRARRNGLALLVLLIAISALPVPVAWATGTGGDAGRRPRRVTEGSLLWRTAQQETPMPAAVIRNGEGAPSLVLLTCYPFDAVRPGGPLRYVVGADAAGG